jgi:hypothetical protein
VVFLALLPVLRIAGTIPGLFAKPPRGLHEFRDFHVFWLSGRAYARSGHVYPSLAVAAHPPAALDGNLFVYPAPSAALFAPLGLLPYPTAAAIFCLVSVAALWGALRLLGVTDWRCYGAVALWPATPASVLVGTLTPLLVLGLAMLWRLRDRPWAAAAITALLLVTKVFLWPLAVWLGATRRSLAAVAGVAAAIRGCYTLSACTSSALHISWLGSCLSRRLRGSRCSSLLRWLGPACLCGHAGGWIMFPHSPWRSVLP